MCNTLSLRVAQLFNESPNAMGLIVAPCCLPTKRHAVQEVTYRLGEHRFTAVDLQKPKSADKKFQLWVEHILEGIGSAESGTVSKRLDIIDVHKVSSSYYAQNAFLFASRPSWPVDASKFLAISIKNAFLPVVEEASYTKKKGDRLPRKKWASPQERIAAREEKKRLAAEVPALDMAALKDDPEKSPNCDLEASKATQVEPGESKPSKPSQASTWCWVFNGPCISR